MDRTVKIFHSFEEAEQAEIKYWQDLSGDKKLEILEELKSRYWALTYERKPGFTPEKSVNILLTNRDEILLDFKKFIELLNKHEVCYLMVGGYALSYHSRPKFTQDIDFWIDKNKENAKKVLRVLEDFGFGGLGISIADLTTSGKIIQLGVEPLRIDLLTSVDGLQFENAYKEKVQGHYYDVPVDIISLDDLIRNKKASSRKKDQQDLEWIEQYRPD